MVNDLQNKVAAWVNENLSRVSAKNPASIHLDELLGREIKNDEILDLSLNAFVHLIEILVKDGVPVKPFLAIVLEGDSREIQFDIPENKKDITNQLSNKPPSLYLVDWDSSKYLTVIEKYQTPLPFELLEDNIVGVYTYFIEYRGAIGIDNDWEFARAIYLDYYPEKFRQR